MVAPAADGIAIALARGPTPHLVHEEHFDVAWPRSLLPLGGGNSSEQRPWAVAVAVEQRVLLFGPGSATSSDDVVILDVAANCSGIAMAQPATVAPGSGWISLTVVDSSRADKLLLVALNATGLYTLTISTSPVGSSFRLLAVIVEPVRLQLPTGCARTCQWQALSAASQHKTLLLLARRCFSEGTRSPATLFEFDINGTLINELNIVAGNSSDWVGMAVADVDGSGRESIYLAQAGGQHKGTCHPNPASLSQKCGPPATSTCQPPSEKPHQYGNPDCECSMPTFADRRGALTNALHVQMESSAALSRQLVAA
eukprot:SAG31_NODE_11263_length_1048_cov_1.454162_1_plen_312_part_10